MSVETTDNAVGGLPAPAQRRRWLTVLLAILIFGAGLVSGGALTTAFVVSRVRSLIHHPEQAPARIAARIGRRLHLDDAQQAKVEAIVAARQRELMRLRGEIQPQIMEQLDGLRTEIGEVLTESQREQWQRMFDEFRERWVPAASAVDAQDGPQAEDGGPIKGTN
jgi:hypothetical protein